MKYLIIDASLSGTGVRDPINGGYMDLCQLDLGVKITEEIKDWLKNYQQEHFQGFKNQKNIEVLDNQGIVIAKKIKKILYIKK